MAQAFHIFLAIVHLTIIGQMGDGDEIATNTLTKQIEVTDAPVYDPICSRKMQANFVKF